MPRIEHDEEFAADLSRQVAYLREHQEFTWIRTLQTDIADLEELLAHFPLSGRKLAERRTDLLLRLRLRTAPFYVWYSFDPADPNGPVRLHRLFHVRQRTPQLVELPTVENLTERIRRRGPARLKGSSAPIIRRHRDAP